MRTIFSDSFFRTAVCIIAAAVLPAVGIVAFTGFERNAVAVRRAEKNALHIVRTVSQVQNTIAASAKVLLTTLAQMDPVRRQEADLSRLFERLDEAHPAYADIFVANESGTIVAAQNTPPDRMQVNDRLYFSRALDEHYFAAGTVTFSRLAGMPLFHFGYRISAPDGSPMVLAAGVRLDYYSHLFSRFTVPPDARLYLADIYGTPAFAMPQLAGTEQKTPEHVWSAAQKMEKREGTFYLNAPAGNMLVAYSRLFLDGDTDPYMLALLVIPADTLLAEANALLRRDMLIFGAALAAMLVLAVNLVRTLLYAPAREMLRAARRYAGGDYTYQPQTAVAGRELAELGTSLGMMARSLERRENDLIAARDSAERAGKAKGEFLANMSHEIRTPMNAIIGMAYLSLKGELTSQQRGYMSKIHEAGSELLRVINDILELSKLDAGKLGMESITFALRDIFAENQRRFSPLARKKGLALHFSVDPGVPRNVVGDPLRLGQVVGHLVDNAVRYTEKGVVRVVCSCEATDPVNVLLRIVVTDTGRGMPAGQVAALERLFAGDSPLLPEKAQGGSGGGLGLFLAHRLVSMMGGVLSVESEPGKGTETAFSVRLGTRPSSRASSVKMLHNIRVLAVDDDSVSLAFLNELLDTFGMRVTVEERAKEALARIREANAEDDPFHLVVLDWRMPVLDGVELTRHIKTHMELARPPAIIMLSAYGWGGIAIQAEQAGVDAFLHKPINESVLLDTIMNLLQLQGAGLLPAETGQEEVETGDSLSGLRVLVVEDNSVNQQVAQEILADAGIAVTLADNGQKALELFETGAEEPPFDLVLMDLQMPVLDGFQTTRLLRSLDAPWAKDLPVIAMTAHSKSSEAAACLEAGLNDHVGKPISVDELFGALLRWRAPRPVEEERTRAMFAELYAGLLRGESGLSLLTAGMEKQIEAHLYAGRAQALQNLLRTGKLHEAAAFLKRLNRVLRFMDNETAGEG